MIRVFTTDNLPELHFVLGLLENEGIEAVPQSEAAAWDWFLVPFAERPSLMVADPQQAARALEIVSEYQRRQAEHVRVPGASSDA